MGNEQMIEILGFVDPAELSNQTLEQVYEWLAENDLNGAVYFVFNEVYQQRVNS